MLKVILLHVIAPWQSAFVPGRVNINNTLVTAELAHFMHNKKNGKEGFMTLKARFEQSLLQS